MSRNRFSQLLLGVLALCCVPHLLFAQAGAIRFPQTPGLPNTGAISSAPVGGSPYGAPAAPTPNFGTPNFGAPASPGVAQPAFGTPGFNAAAQPPTLNGPAMGSAPMFDPYSTSPAAAQQWWSGGNPVAGTPGTFGTPPTTPVFGGSGSGVPPWRQSSPFGNPTGPAFGNGAPFGSNNPYGGLNSQPYNSPFGPPDNSLFPNGFNNGQQYDWNNVYKLFQDLRLRHTYVIDGDGPTDLSINDTETSVTMTIPNFLFTQQPVFITPAFALHLWDGPYGISADLPANAYSAYLDAQWSTDPQMQLGAEFGVRVGAYSDFRTFNSKSVRVQGMGLGTLKLTPTLTAKLGVSYINRNRIKLLPAGGFIWQPNPKTRFDIFFPQPRFSQMITTLNQGELWWYVNGEYGGGAWTIQRTSGDGDRIDINDIRVGLGTEWHGPKDMDLFFEGGFVFYREVVYVNFPADTFKPGDGYYIRGGISF